MYIINIFYVFENYPQNLRNINIFYYFISIFTFQYIITITSLKFLKSLLFPGHILDF